MARPNYSSYVSRYSRIVAVLPQKSEAEVDKSAIHTDMILNKTCSLVFGPMYNTLGNRQAKIIA